MNKAKTLKRRLGNAKSFFSVAWDTDDIPDKICVNPNLKWRDIDWKKVEKNVFKLQKLIYRASSRGEIRKMRKYQKLLIKSHDALLLAVRNVTQDNQGKKTAGIDGIKNLPPMQRLHLVDLLKSRDLKASPTQKVSIPKTGRNQKRRLGIHSLYDLGLQTLVKLGMEPEWEAHFETNTYGFRPGRSTDDAIQAIYLSINDEPKYVLNADISKCMSEVNHHALLGKIDKSPYRQLVKQWLKSGVFDKSQFDPPLLELGTPQGEVISPLLANIALHGMEKCLQDFAETLPGNKRDNIQALSLVRYAGNFVILHKDIEVVMQAKAVVQEWLNNIGLELKPEKTRIAHTLEEYEGNQPGFDFLGFTVRQWKVKTSKQGFKTLIKPSKQSINTHYRKMAEVCDTHKSATVKVLITKLNPIIREWANYFSAVVSNDIFQKLDHLLLRRIWRWASRRHSNKSAAWVKEKYFPHREGTKSWVLKDEEYILNLHSDVSIIRHVKVKDNKSPYDGDWIYWSSRMVNSPGIRKEVSTLLKKQKGKCAFCGLSFRPTDTMEVYHVIPRSEKGNNTSKNKELLHRHCHDTKTALERETSQSED